jgi:8-oxo-dGTP diphosphatase
MGEFYQQEIRMPYTYEYPRPAVSTDIVVFAFDGTELKVLLIERGEEPFKGKLALPGGFLNMDETTDQCAMRELMEETGVEGICMEQLGVFSEVDRDPRGRVITVAYYALVKMGDCNPVAGDDASKVSWFGVNNIPPLAFDHDLVLNKAISLLRRKARYNPVAFNLLDKEFSMNLLQSLYQAIFDTEFDPSIFTHKMISTGFLAPPLENQVFATGKGELYYRFDWEKYNQDSGQGFLFDL